MACLLGVNVPTRFPVIMQPLFIIVVVSVYCDLIVLYLPNLLW